MSDMRITEHLFSFVDLFSGCGGNSWGMIQPRNTHPLRPLLALDTDEIALQTYHVNMPEVEIVCRDIQKTTSASILKKIGLQKGELGCLVASPPCQTYSRNNRIAKSQLDQRHTLYKNVLRLVRYIKPWVVFMENVPEMKTENGGKYHKDCLNFFKKEGYRVGVWTVNAADYGVPQMRQRLIYLAYHKSLGVKPSLPAITNSYKGILPKWVTIEDAISDLPHRQSGSQEDSFIVEHATNLSTFALNARCEIGQTVFNHSSRSLDDTQIRRIESLAEGQGYKDLPDDLRPKKGYAASYGRLWRNRPAPTLTTYLQYPSTGRYAHYEQHRVITVREALRLQSFDDRFVVCGQTIDQSRQIGNAVPPLLAAAFKDKIVEDLQTVYQESPSS